MTGKILAIVIVLAAVIAGVGLYYTQEYAYYAPVAPADPAADVYLTALIGGAPELVPSDGFEGIDADTSPLRFRACFTMPTSVATLSETYVIYETPVPLVAPRQFGCFDAVAIGEALETGDAVAFLGQANITYGVDRVIAVFPDGRAYAWNQMNHCGEVVYDGKPAPEGCPTPPETD
ncbi:DUF6446 family protein [Actibacterium sp. D379-3]